MILHEEKKGGELVQKTRKSTLKLALAFSLKLQKSWKLWIMQECALTKMGSLLVGKILSKYFQSARGGIFGKFEFINGIGYKLAIVGSRKLIKKINYFILSIGMGFDYSKT